MFVYSVRVSVCCVRVFVYSVRVFVRVFVCSCLCARVCAQRARVCVQRARVCVPCVRVHSWIQRQAEPNYRRIYVGLAVFCLYKFVFIISLLTTRNNTRYCVPI